jgi:2-dehydropantoate 2-reductase
MRVLVVGAGSLGTVVAAALAASGCQVVLYCRPAQVAPIRAEGLTLSGIHDVQARVDATAESREIGPVDCLLLAVKTRDTGAALAAVRDVPIGAAASLQNGLAKDEQLVAAFGRERVLGATTILGATATGPGRATWTLAGRTYFGELDGPPTPRVEALVAAFNTAGLPAEAVADVRAAEWSKLCQIVPAAALSALTRLPYYQGFNPYTLVTLPRAEAAAALVARGDAMRAQGLTEMRISLLQDVLRGRPTEVEETLGYVVRRAAHHGVEVPLTRFAYGVIRGAESYF